jgi:hypothetical protein
MTTLCTAASQYLAAISSLHPLAEAMNRFTATSVWLKCAFHLKKFTISKILCLAYGRAANAAPYLTTLRGTIPAAGERDCKTRKK